MSALWLYRYQYRSRLGDRWSTWYDEDESWMRWEKKGGERVDADAARLADGQCGEPYPKRNSAFTSGDNILVPLDPYDGKHTQTGWQGLFSNKVGDRCPFYRGTASLRSESPPVTASYTVWYDLRRYDAAEGVWWLACVKFLSSQSKFSWGAELRYRRAQGERLLHNSGTDEICSNSNTTGTDIIVIQIHVY